MPVLPARTLRTVLLVATSCVGFGLFVIGVRVPIGFLALAFGLACKNARRVAASGWSHGTARVARLVELLRLGMLGDDGLILGSTALLAKPSLRDGVRALWSPSYPVDMACFLFLSALGGARWAGERLIRVRQFTHLLTVAPTGKGKGVSVLVVNLLSYVHSCVVIDPKGELYGLTAEHRRRKFGHLVFLLDPFGVCGAGSHTLNPFDFLDPDAEDFLDQCRKLADMIIFRTGKETEPYWNDAARHVLTAFIAYVAACEHDPAQRNLDTVRDLVSGRGSYEKAVEWMQKVETHGGVIQRLGHSLTWHVDRELGSVMSNVQRQTEAFDSPAVARCLGTSSFDPRWLRQRRVTIYLCLSHDQLEPLAPLMRLWVGVILQTITRGKPSEKNPVLFLLDEAGHLGRLQALETAVTLMRGMGVRLWFFFQSLNQLHECYGDKAKTILENIDTRQYFGTNAYETAEAVSKEIGDATIAVASRGENTNWSRNTGGTGPPSGSVSGGSSVTVSEAGRRLYKPEEILALPERYALVFHKNLAVIPAWLIRFYTARGCG